MKTRFRFPLRILALTGLAGMLLGCGSNPLRDLSIEDSQSFITNFDPAAPFGTHRTFAIMDSVYVIENRETSVSTAERDMVFQRRAVENMLALGYVRVARSQRPDLAMTVARVNRSSTSVVPGPWFPGWGGGWGWGGGFFYPPFFVFQTQENYWYTELADLKNVRGNTPPTVIWNAQSRGGGLFDPPRVPAIVDAIFAQSAYLKPKN